MLSGFYDIPFGAILKFGVGGSLALVVVMFLGWLLTAWYLRKKLS